MHSVFIIGFVAGVVLSPLAIFWLVSAAVSTAPSPEEVGRVSKSAGKLLFYTWIYKVAHVIVGNAAHVIPSLRFDVGPGPDDKNQGGEPR